MVSRILIASLAFAAGCAVGPDRVDPEVSKNASVAQAFAARFPIGAAIEPWQLDAPEAGLLRWHFNSVTAENAMKPAALQPREGRFAFAGADRIVDYAMRNGMRVRGHTLLWHEQTPDWMWEAAGRAATRAEVIARLHAHIAAVVGRYRGRVYAWDVVNEVIDARRADCLRDTEWLRVVGPDYIALAFRFAHEADPAARLFINDFDTTEPAKRACLARVVGDLMRRGVPVHGIGHQMHVGMDQPAAADVEAALAELAALGLESQVTEMDVSLGDAPRDLERQAARYGELFRVFVAHGEVTGVTLWGVSDAHSWLNATRAPADPDRPLLFDASLHPKPAYRAVVDAIIRGSSRQ